MISHLDHLVLTVSDIESSVAFYRRTLMMRDSHFAQGRRALHFGSQKINLQRLGQEKRNRAAVGSGDLCLITTWTLDRVIAHLKIEGVDILEGPVAKTGAMGAMQSIYFCDPDGNLIEISRYDDDGLNIDSASDPEA
ncbi:VOC family protein [Thioalkalivibrio sp. HK1]|uniref:VOC family protein n=1 Tax=Thioalkalivibrio sp. HK1 TaxID=1469245 RepID=UPI000471D159|nr:VOC family protein [Thioalkalivibrio sp. HK1]